ncbi:MAG: hypothetical protein U1F43_13180 [Myxococcota bacterium]
MRLDEHRHFTARLAHVLQSRGDILGLVALGSMAEQGEAPDDFSDHDFFVIAEPSAAESYRERVDWLPDADAIVHHYRETAHGVKAFYRGGHFVEYAVFTPDEIALARVNRYRVLFDRGDVARRMDAVAVATRERVLREAPSDDWLVGQLLGEALVAALRDARGEHTSGAQRRQSATQHLLRLVARHVPSPTHHRLDDLDATRRVELAYPELAQRLDLASRRSAREHALCILDVAAEALAPRVPGFPAEALAVVRQRVASL